jgi:small glutamine-rich tetratricopeptide repeat-containing protein alpha
MSTTPKQRLALAICDFLSTSLTDGTLTSEEKDSIDIAINCIGESFGVDPSDKAAVSSAVGAQNLFQIYSVYEKLKSASPSKPAGAAAAAGASAPTPAAAPTDEQKKQAEALKSKGNAAMAQRDYPTAIDFYTQALALHPGNAIFLSNRAAAYSAARDHEAARADAEAAVAVDPKYTKAWSRLGLARFALGDAKGSMEAYQKGIEHEGNGGSEAMKKGYETAKRRVDEIAAEEAAGAGSTRGVGGGGGGSPGLGDLASMLGGAGGGGGGGGMPDFASIMNNPMFASMAQNLMSNPDMMANLMNNPRLREMADSFGRGGGGGMPDISSLMSDPSVAEMARNLMGGAGRGGPGGAPGGNGR